MNRKKIISNILYILEYYILVDELNTILGVIFLLVIISALFSLAETAFFSLTKIHIKMLEKETKASAKRILKLLAKPKQLLVTTLLANTLVNISATAIATLYMLRWTADFSSAGKSLMMALLVIVMTVVILVFCEIIPKLYAFSAPVRVARFTAIFIYIVRFMFYPIIIAIEWFIHKLSKKEDWKSPKKDDWKSPLRTAFSHEEIRNIVQSDSTHHPLEENEKKIIDSIFRFSSTAVKEIMVPRVDITGVEFASSIDEVKKAIIDSGYSRIPVYKKTLDEIIGIIYAKDLILYPEKSNIKSIQRKVTFVPENMKIQTLLNQFQSKKRQIAIVVDEYGGTSGLVTLEDILEELVGEIMDEYDNEQPMITQMAENNYLVSAMIQVSELNREFDLNLNEEFDNLAELLCSELNHIPVRNEKYVHEDTVEFVITQVKKQRVNFVRMKINV